MPDAVIIKSGTCPNAILQGNIAKKTHPDTRWRGIANAHLSDAQHTTAFRHAIIHKVTAYLNGPVKLILTHRRFIEEVLSASGYLTIDNTFNTRQVVIHTDIDNPQLKAMLSTEHIHAASTLGKVNHLLPRDLTGTDTDALTLNAMIAAKKQMARMCQRGFQSLLDETHLHRQLLQAA